MGPNYRTGARGTASDCESQPVSATHRVRESNREREREKRERFWRQFSNLNQYYNMTSSKSTLDDVIYLCPTITLPTSQRNRACKGCKGLLQPRDRCNENYQSSTENDGAGRAAALALRQSHHSAETVFSSTKSESYQETVCNSLLQRGNNPTSKPTESARKCKRQRETGTKGV